VSHNTVLVGGRSQAKPYEGELGYWRDLDDVVFLSAGTKTYAPVEHVRTVAFVPGEYFLVFDRLSGGGGPSAADWLVHCPPGLKKGAADNLDGPDRGPGLRVISPEGETHDRVELGKGHGAVPVEWSPDWKPLDAWRDDIDYAAYAKTAGAGGLTFVFALVPYRDQAPQASLVSVPVLENGKALPETEARAVEMGTGGFRDTHLRVFTGGRAVSCSGIETDARQAWVRRDAYGRVISSGMVDGTRLSIDGRPVSPGRNHQTGSHQRDRGPGG
jgi:hypothetical protein